MRTTASWDGMKAEQANETTTCTRRMGNKHYLDLGEEDKTAGRVEVGRKGDERHSGLGEHARD